MAANIANWATELANKDKSAEDKALSKARKMEKDLAKMGWRWCKVNERLKIFVPCDKDGNPTPLGQEKIRKQKLLMGI